MITKELKNLKMSKKIKKQKEIVVNSFEDLKKVIILRDGSLMDMDEWTQIPYEGTSKTEDAEFEIIKPKQIENKK